MRPTHAASMTAFFVALLSGCSDEGSSSNDAIDCDCPGGYFTRDESGGSICNCPPSCRSDDGCTQGEFCAFPDGFCGERGDGYCQSIARASELHCFDSRATCGCDGQAYADFCVASAAGVSTSIAPPSECAATPVPCSSAPGATTCYAGSQYCETLSTTECKTLQYANQPPCQELTCECILPLYDDSSCTCTTLDSGITSVVCD
jgi:hypothetical protein